MQPLKSAQNFLTVKGRTQHNVNVAVEGAPIPVARWPWQQYILGCPLIFLSPQYWLCCLSSFSGSKTLGLFVKFSKIRASLFPSSVEMSTSFCSSVPVSEEHHVPVRCRPQPLIMSHFKLELCLKASQRRCWRFGSSEMLRCVHWLVNYQTEFFNMIHPVLLYQYIIINVRQ